MRIMPCEPYQALIFRLTGAAKRRHDSIRTLLISFDDESVDVDDMEEFQMKITIDALIDEYNLSDSREDIKGYLVEYFNTCRLTNCSPAADVG
jgi:hypothetical protein